ncbi:hypothetical protein AOXY_G493 [Acipenser oxyrinchus oxyrinchus]|uniref:E3 ubiquitin-protein ligase Topors n=1 Tax=Acipenser oxyrinchus oxyrinchus TaxID=40147 RepID=A0AAD8GKP8_ACIOX|nr:hypothetical protein AOXY_G493 [Acipenser oxyrinchus oxyrinchus]
MASTKIKLRMHIQNVPKGGSSKILQTVSAEASPDSKCPICLDRFNKVAYLDHCLHKFCYECIHEWSKNKAECPLCKQPFDSIYRTIEAENNFKELVLRPTESGSFGSPDGHRYRTTMTRRTSPPPDNVILFEGLMGNAPPQRDRGVQRMKLRFVARRRAQTEGRLMQEQDMINFRRALYQTGVRVRNVHDGGRYRDISAEFWRRNPACLHRLVPWLKRELTVFYGDKSLVNIVQNIIMTHITRYDMEDQAIRNELKPFLLNRTDHFLHEFISFARAPYSMDAYDQHAVYDCAAVSFEEGSSSELSVITISADEADTEEDQGTLSMAGSGLSQAPWDDETPGPSYSAMEQVQPAMFSVCESESVTSGDEEGQIRPLVQESAQVKTDPSANEGADASSTDEDCVIVGFVKPLAERTPELVQLSSDSEESVHSESTEVPAQPQHLRFPSNSSPPSSVCSVVSKDKPPHRHKTPDKKETSKDRDQSNLSDKARHSPTHRPSDRDKNSRGTDTSNTCSKGMHAHDNRRHHRPDRLRSKERSRQKNKRRSKSTENSWSIKSTTTSLNSDSTLSRGRRQSRSGTRDYPPSRDMGCQLSRDNNNSYSRHSHEKSYSYHLDSYSHYSRDRGSNDSLYMQNRSYSASYYVSPDHRTRSHSNSRSNRSSSSSHRDYHHRERRRSRSFSSNSSRASCSAHRRSRHDKPSGKRKYKTRHLEGTSKEVTSKSYTSSSYSLPEKRGSSESHHRKSRKKSRSLSVEIVYDGKATVESSRCHKKHKCKKKCKRHRSREKAGHQAPTVITIDSDGDHEMESFRLNYPKQKAVLLWKVMTRL